MEKYKLKQKEIPVIFHDDSSASDAFKQKLKMWVLDVLDSNTLTNHLKEINVYLEDEGMKESKIQRIKDQELKRVHALHNLYKGIVIHTDWCEACYDIKGEDFFLQGLAATMTHELVHYVFSEINKSTAKMVRASDVLIKKYKKKYPVFQKAAFAGMLEVMNAFVNRSVDEGFAQLIDQMKHNQLVFSKAKFEELYANATDVAEKMRHVLAQAPALDDIDALEDLLIANVLEVQTYSYAIGLHMIYTLFYFHETSLEKDVDYVIGLFLDSFGRLTPKKIVKEYSRVMREHDKNPVISYEATPYLNLTDMREAWQVLLKKFTDKNAVSNLI